MGILDDLLHRKAIARELGTGHHLPALDRMTQDAMAAAEARLETQPRPAESLIDDANALFRAIISEAV